MITIGTVQLHSPELRDSMTVVNGTQLWLTKSGTVRTYNKTVKPALVFQLDLTKVNAADKAALEGFFNNGEFTYIDYNDAEYTVRFNTPELVFTAGTGGYYSVTIGLEGYEKS